MCRFSRRRGKLCPGAGKAVSRRRRKVSRALAADEVQGWCHAFLVFSVPKKVVCWRRESLLSGAGERSARRRLASLLGQKPICSPAPRKLFPGAGERSHSFTIEEKCVGFPGAGGSCVPAPGKLFPGRRKVSRANSHAASRRRRMRLNKKAHQSLEPVIMNMTCPLCCWGYLLGLSTLGSAQGPCRRKWPISNCSLRP